MKRLTLILAVALAAGLTACSGGDSGTSTSGSGSSTGSSGGSSGGSTGGTTGSAPTIAITSPADNATVTIGTDTAKSVPLTLAITNFTLMAPGACTNHHDDHCGHVHLLVDGTACNDPGGLPYNNDATSTDATVKLAQCPTATGAHTIVAELHRDDHSAITDSSGAVISSTVHVTAQ